MDIDLVYLWVDGNDSEWQVKHKSFSGPTVENSEINCKGRYVNNDELKYSLRSAEKHAPWIRKIFIVTDNQKPEWLDVSNPKIKIIDHKEILPEECLPCFNAFVIEYFIYKIPGLSEHFLFANDDMFFNAGLLPDFFFANDSFPIVRLRRRPYGKWHNRVYRLGKFLTGNKLGIYQKTVSDAALLVDKMYGKYFSDRNHHNIDAYKKTDFREAIENIFSKQVKKSLLHHIRNMEDLQRSVILYYALAIGHGHLKYVTYSESMGIPVHNPDFMEFLNCYQPKLFCLNDCQRSKDTDRERIRPFLEKLFPEKSIFEK